MPEFEVEVEFEAFCSVCGAGICNNIETGATNGRGQLFIRVEPCDDCLENTRIEISREGYDEGYAAAMKEIEEAEAKA